MAVPDGRAAGVRVPRAGHQHAAPHHLHAADTGHRHHHLRPRYVHSLANHGDRPPPFPNGRGHMIL